MLKNYRPVLVLYVLPLLSETLERLMYNRIINFINHHKLFYKYQFGFRECHSTILALIVLVERLLKTTIVPLWHQRIMPPPGAI